MKILLHIAIFSIFSISFGQSSIDVYENILKEIKNSNDFKEYTIDSKKKYSNFKISPYLSSFCENFTFNKNYMEISEDYCINADIINEEIILRNDIKKLSGKGKKTHMVYFSKTIDSYISVEVSVRKWKHESLLYLFKIDKKNNAELLNVFVLFKE